MAEPHTAVLTAYDIANLSGEIDRMAESILSRQPDDLVQQSIAYNIRYAVGYCSPRIISLPPSKVIKTSSEDDL